MTAKAVTKTRAGRASRLFEIQPGNYTYLSALRIMLRLAPVQILLITLDRVLNGVFPGLNALATASFINAAIAIVSSGVPVSAAVPGLAGILAITAYNQLRAPALEYINAVMKCKLGASLRGGTVKKRAMLEYHHIESNEDWELITRVCAPVVAKDIESQFMEMFGNFGNMIWMALSTLSIMWILFSSVWWSAILMLLVAVPLMWLSMRSGKKIYDAEKESRAATRKYEYLTEALTCREAASERHMFGYTKAWNRRFYDAYLTARNIRYKVQAKQFVVMKSGGVAVSMIAVSVAMILAAPVAAGKISVGMFIALITAIITLAQGMSWTLPWTINNVSKHIEYMKDFTAFSNMSEQSGAELLPAEDAPEFEGLEFKNVSFKYPGTQRWVLRNLSLSIRSGGHYAFVGINGAGKTTITKLLTGLYTQYEGSILLNGKELNLWPQDKLKGMFCGVFQDFAKYYISARENITIGDVRTMGAPDEEKLARAIELSGFGAALENLPGGLNAHLGKLESDGTDISGGEWQRLAIARALMNTAPVKILDEPTAALDPTAESEVYERFQDISENKTTLFISHRLGATKMAERIFVLADGCVAESGSHLELMAAGGLYKEMFDSQQSWYK